MRAIENGEHKEDDYALAIVNDSIWHGKIQQLYDNIGVCMHET